ncbi:MAG: SpoIIE family protein phosphatase [Bradyrhizobiaceae bacterium]|nr:SpoIIE family protein phosphatase [Bradyrhizobiaceae bacterium]
MTVPPSMNLASLLDLVSQAESMSETNILQSALFSLMGRLRATRACVLRGHHGVWSTQEPLCKGVSPFELDQSDVTYLESLGGAGTVHELEADGRQGRPSGLTERGFSLLVPLTSHGDSLGVIAIGMLIAPDDGKFVQQYLELAGMLISIAVANSRHVESMRKATKELEARNLLITSLYESAHDFTQGRTDAELFKMLQFRLMGQLMVSSFVVYLKHEYHGDEVIVVPRNTPELEALYPDILECTEPTIVSEMSDDHPLKERLKAVNLAMLAPFTLHGECVGILAIRPKLSGQEFTKNELGFVESLGNAAIAALENNRLLEEELEKQRMDLELSIAASIQQKLIASNPDHRDGLDLAVEMRSSRQIGGDYVDVIPLDTERTMFVVADVAGKGIPAALLMATVQASIRVLATLDLPLTELVRRINTLIFDSTEPEVFVTAFIGVVDDNSRTMQYINAGHNPPLLVHGDNVLTLSAGGLILGVLAEPPAYQTGECTMVQGSTLVLYTDGITEARVGMDEFGVERLSATIRQHQASSAREVLSQIHRAVGEFLGEESLNDDASVIVAKVL